MTLIDNDQYVQSLVLRRIEELQSESEANERKRRDLEKRIEKYQRQLDALGTDKELEALLQLAKSNGWEIPPEKPAMLRRLLKLATDIDTETIERLYYKHIDIFEKNKAHNLSDRKLLDNLYDLEDAEYDEDDGD